MILTTDDLELEIYGSFQPFAEQPSSATRQDLYSVFLSRATSMRWSEAVSDRPPLASLWGMADASVASDRNGMISAFHVVPLMGPGEPLPVQPLIQCAVDSMRRLGALEFRGLRLGLPLGRHHASDGLLIGTTNWFLAAASPHPVEVMAEVTFDEVSEALGRGGGLTAEIRARHIEPFIVLEAAVTEPRRPGSVAPAAQTRNEMINFVAPEWSPEAAAWVTAAIVDAAVRRGHRGHAVVQVAPLGLPA